jgi:hypothetical protein
MNFKNALQMISIKKYNGTPQEIKNGQFRFFIQSHGFNAGRPLRSPKTNCWEFISEREADFEILYIIFESKILQSFIRGSVIPLIKLIVFIVYLFIVVVCVIVFYISLIDFLQFNFN